MKKAAIKKVEGGSLIKDEGRKDDFRTRERRGWNGAAQHLGSWGRTGGGKTDEKPR